MAKAYWITFYRSISDADAMKNYAALAGPAIQKYGGHFLVRGIPDTVYENGLKERVVMIEFESVKKAIEAHESPEYSAALKALGNGANREIRIAEGI